MTWTYGNSGGSTIEESEIKKDLTITAVKSKIRFQIEIWRPNAFQECFIAVLDSTGTIIPMNENFDATHGSYTITYDGHIDRVLSRVDGLNWALTDIVTIRFRSLPWDVGYPQFFYSINLSLVD